MHRDGRPGDQAVRPPGSRPESRANSVATRSGSSCRPGSCYVVLFIVPTIVSLLLRAHPVDAVRLGVHRLRQLRAVLQRARALQRAHNTLIYARRDLGAKVVLGLLLAVLLTAPIIARGYLRSVMFFPVLVSTDRCRADLPGAAEPHAGLVNKTLGVVGIDGPGWLSTRSSRCSRSPRSTSGRASAWPRSSTSPASSRSRSEYFEAAEVDGASAWQHFRHIILPLSFPATTTVILLSLIGGLRSFDLIWTMTRGGPGFTSDVIASVIYKQYQAGFYGLSTAGNVVLFLVVDRDRLPAVRVPQPTGGGPVRRTGAPTSWSAVGIVLSPRDLPGAVRVHPADRHEDRRVEADRSTSPGRPRSRSSTTSVR